MASAPMWMPISRSVWRAENDRSPARSRFCAATTGGACASLTCSALARGAAPAVPAGPSATRSHVRLDISVATADDIVVDNNYGRLELGSQLDARRHDGHARAGRAAEFRRRRPGVSRRTDLRGAARHDRLHEPDPIEPVLDLALETRVQQDDITLEITGTPDTLDVSVRSPGLSQQDAISILLTGQPADDIDSHLHGDRSGTVAGAPVGRAPRRGGTGESDSIRFASAAASAPRHPRSILLATRIGTPTPG